MNIQFLTWTTSNLSILKNCGLASSSIFAEYPVIVEACADGEFGISSSAEKNNDWAPGPWIALGRLSPSNVEAEALVKVVLGLWFR